MPSSTADSCSQLCPCTKEKTEAGLYVESPVLKCCQDSETFKVLSSQPKHGRGPHLGLPFAVSVFKGVSFWSRINSAPRVPENVLSSWSSISPKGPLLSPGGETLASSCSGSFPAEHTFKGCLSQCPLFSRQILYVTAINLPQLTVNPQSCIA